jgi:hypothetical protein
MSIPQPNVLKHSAWRHWGCVTPKIIENVKKSFEDPQELDGFDELNDEDKEKLKVAWDAGHVADEDIPPTAIKAADEEEEEKPKRRAPKKRKEVEDNDEEEEKPRKARGKKPKVSRTHRSLEYLQTALSRLPKVMTRNLPQNPRRLVLVSPRYECHGYLTWRELTYF